MDRRRAALAVGDLVSVPMQLRDNVTMYDAAYIALAEALGTTLLTADRRLSRSTGIRCTVELVR
jgi:predicted nucleic acid-binding protein